MGRTDAGGEDEAGGLRPIGPDGDEEALGGGQRDAQRLLPEGIVARPLVVVPRRLTGGGGGGGGAATHPPLEAQRWPGREVAFCGLLGKRLNN